MTTPTTTNVHKFSYKGKEIRAFVTEKEVWFVLTDICEAISASINDVLLFLDIDEKISYTLDDKSLTCVSGSGCYHIIAELNTQFDLVDFRNCVSSEATRLLPECANNTELEATTELSLNSMNGTNVLDSRIMADALGIEHRALIQNISIHQSGIEKMFGAVTFEMEPRKNGNLGGSQRKTAFLTEDQSLFIVTLSKNTPKVFEFKGRIIKAFANARRAAQSLLPPNPEALQLLRTEITSSLLQEITSTIMSEVIRECKQEVMKDVRAAQKTTDDKAVLPASIPQIDPKLTISQNMANLKSIQNANDSLLNAQEAAELLNMSINTLRNWRYLGVGPKIIMLGKSVRYKRCDLLEYIENSDGETLKSKHIEQIVNKIDLCKNIKGKGVSSAARADLSDIRRIKLLQEYLEISEDKKVSQGEVVKLALDALCNVTIYSLSKN